MSLIDQIIQAESGGNANARNPRSSASGAGQFIDATWLSMLARHRPDIQGTREELLALKSDPNLSRAMTEAYAADNGAILSGAGLPVTPGNTYLAHFAGPQGAVNVLSSDPSAPVESILGAAAVKANPFLQGMTAGDLQAWAGRKMGAPNGASVQPQQAAPASFQSIPPMAAPIFTATADQPAAKPKTMWESMPAPTPQESQLAPFTPPPRRKIDLRSLQAALSQARPQSRVF